VELPRFSGQFLSVGHAVCRLYLISSLIGDSPASRSWALLLARIYENRPLQCPRCGQAMTILAFILDREVIERILRHIGEEPTPPRVLPARSPPQREMDFAQTAGPVSWDEVNQTTEWPDDR